MIGLAIAAVFGTPIVVLAAGFVGVSKKRAEEGRAHIVVPSSAASPAVTVKETTEQPAQNKTQPAF